MLTLTIEAEARALWECTTRLRLALAQGDDAEAADLLDELQVLVMHSDRPAIRQRALAAIASAMPGAPDVSVAPDGHLCFSFT